MADQSDVLAEAPGRRVLKLDGRVAVVTGSESGIGQAMAEAFSLEGADIVITRSTAAWN